MDPLPEDAIYNERFVKGLLADALRQESRGQRHLVRESVFRVRVRRAVAQLHVLVRAQGGLHVGVRGLAGDPGVLRGARHQVRVGRAPAAVARRDGDAVNDAAGRLAVEARNLITGAVVEDWCHILVHATGYLNKPAWPSVPGLETYGGAKLHSADYDEAVWLEGKDVLLIGGGSSAVQILPAIQPVANRVKIFIRSPSWMLPDISTESGAYTPLEIEGFVNDPHAVQELRQNNERTMNSIFKRHCLARTMTKPPYVEDEKDPRRRSDDEEPDPHVRSRMQTCHSIGLQVSKGKYQVIGPSLSRASQLRPGRSSQPVRDIYKQTQYRDSTNLVFYTLKKDNVDVVYSAVSSFTDTGCTSEDGVSHTGSVIFCATGFDTSYVPRYPVLVESTDGKQRNLQDEWAASIEGYMGVGIPEYPNTFTLLGPWTPVSNGPTLVAIKAQIDYVCAFIDRWQTEPTLHSVRPKRAACDDFKAYAARAMENLAMREVRWDDWEFSYKGNRFAWLVDGVSRAEWEPTADLAYYIRERDDGRHGSRRARTLEIAKAGSQPPRVLHRQAKLAMPN
ncbi:hypothetical protein DL767_001216 [Monosporascus sp. MG133]|nr:hypothetical protein DL767_001216 [Monosporascus sp. MG133]